MQGLKDASKHAQVLKVCKLCKCGSMQRSKAHIKLHNFLDYLDHYVCPHTGTVSLWWFSLIMCQHGNGGYSGVLQFTKTIS